MEVEEVPAERMLRWPVNVNLGLQPYAIREICRRLGIGGGLQKQMLELVPRLYRLFRELDAELVEINPLALCGSGLIAADAKVTIDEDALYRHKELPRITEKTALELRAEELGLAFVELGGEIAVMANGAGITMATLIWSSITAELRLTLDKVAGRSGTDGQRLGTVANYQSPRILINIFGGITRRDVVAEAFAQVKESQGLIRPIFRLVGTNEEEGRAVL